MGPFIMNPEGVARFFARAGMAEGPFPEHYEPFETPLGNNPLNPGQPTGGQQSGGARVQGRPGRVRHGRQDFPHVATTYRLTEHFHYWTQARRAQRDHAAASSSSRSARSWRRRWASRNGDRVKVSSNRGHITAVAVVTKRIKPMQIDGKKVHTVGLPIHWGFTGVAKPGYLANTLTPVVGDGNSQTPEFKSFLVKVEKV